MRNTNATWTTNSKGLMHNASKRRFRRPFPYTRVARMWAKGKTIAQIAHAIKREDTKNPNGDLYHSLRNFLHRMHNVGYKDENGRLRRLPHRVSRGTVRKARHAGLRAW
jgi:hypothetical protein